MRTYSFEKLDAWKASRELVKWIYLVTENFPASEKYGIIAQLRRSSISIVSNLAEGSARSSWKDKAHFTQIAYSSLLELLNQLIISCDLFYLQEYDLQVGRHKIENLSGQIAALRNFQLRKLSNPNP